MMNKNIIIPIIAILYFQFTYSQDKIYLRKDTISAKILESESNFIKYQLLDSIIVKKKMTQILKIEYSDNFTEDYGSKNPKKLWRTNVGLVFSISCITKTDFQYSSSDNISILKLQYSRFITHYLAFDLSIESYYNDPFLGLGLRGFINDLYSTKRFAPYFGFHIGGYDLGSSQTAMLILKIPIGIDYVFKKGFNLGLEFNPGELIPVHYTKNPIYIPVDSTIITKPKPILFTSLKFAFCF